MRSVLKSKDEELETQKLNSISKIIVLLNGSAMSASPSIIINV
jgi:hypothetical protein